VSKRMFTKEQELQFCKKYVEDKLSTIELAKIYNCSQVTICNVLRRNGCCIRNSSDSHKGQRAWNKGLTKETNDGVKRISDSKKDIPRPKWIMEKLRRINTGKFRSEKAKQLTSKSLEGHIVLDETRKKLKDSLKEFYKSEKGIQKRKELQKYMLQYIKYNSIFKNTKPELKMQDIVMSLNIPYEKQFRIRGKGHNYDGHLLNTNILIEVDGDYWHGNPKLFSKLSKRQQGQKERDLRNAQLAKDNNYILLRFWESDILKNENIVRNKLMEVING